MWSLVTGAQCDQVAGPLGPGRLDSGQRTVSKKKKPRHATVLCQWWSVTPRHAPPRPIRLSVM